MRGTAALLPAKNKLKQIYPPKGTWGNVHSLMPSFFYCSMTYLLNNIGRNFPGSASTSTLKREGNNDFREQGTITNEKIDPIVAFSKPPPLPPVLGPLVALSLLEAWWSRDSNDDWQVMWIVKSLPLLRVLDFEWTVINALYLKKIFKIWWIMLNAKANNRARNFHRLMHNARSGLIKGRKNVL